MKRGSASGFNHVGRTIPINPVAADIACTLKEFSKCSRLHHIAIRPAGIAGSQVGLVVRRGEDDDGDRTEAGIGPEPFQKVAAIPSAKLEIEQNQSGDRVVVHAVLQEMQCSIRIVLGIEDYIEGGLDQCQAKQLAFAGAVFDQEDGGVRHHYMRGISAGNVPGSKMKR